MENKNINYYEAEFSDGYSICIKGERKPTITEANEFLKVDCMNMKTTVINVLDIDNNEAHNFFDMSNEDKFPVFQ